MTLLAPKCPGTKIAARECHVPIDTWVWQKPTNTGLFLNFKAVCPLNWKSGLISCMLYCAKIICSNDTLFNKKVNQPRSLSLSLINNYATRFFDKVLRKFVVKDHSLLDHSSSVEKDTDFEMCALSKFHMFAYIQNGLPTIYPNL